MRTVQVNWQPQKGTKLPIYRQFVTYCLQQIQLGNWLVGDRLPTQRRLALQIGVNRATIHSAMAELQALGVVMTAHGAGSRIANNTWATMGTAAPNWHAWVAAGGFSANQPLIQQINQAELTAKYRLGTGELGPDLLVTDRLQAALSRTAQQLPALNYLPALGSITLRQALVANLAQWGIRTTADNILITSGSLQALQLITAALLEPGTTVYTAAASYLHSLRVLEAVNAKWAPLPVDNQGLQYWHVPATPAPQLLYTVTSFANPLGTVMTAQRRHDLLQFAHERQLPLIEDSAYQTLWLDQRPPRPLKAADTHGNVLYLGTASKALAPGLRIGWLVAPQAVVARLADVKMQMDYGASTLSQLTLANVLTAPDYAATLTQIRAGLRQRRDAALAALSDHLTGLATWNHPAGGFYIWVTLPTTVNVKRLFQAALAHGVLVNPGEVYGALAPTLRLSYAYATPTEFRTGIHILAGLIQTELGGRRG